MSVHLADVKKVLRTYSIEVSAREADDLAEDPIVTRLRKVRLNWSISCHARFDTITRRAVLVMMVYNLVFLISPTLFLLRLAN